MHRYGASPFLMHNNGITRKQRATEMGTEGLKFNPSVPISVARCLRSAGNAVKWRSTEDVMMNRNLLDELTEKIARLMPQAQALGEEAKDSLRGALHLRKNGSGDTRGV